jgi:starvation-inducible outer membrane lipoprotein
MKNQMKKLLLLVCISVFLSACGAVTEKISGETKSGEGTKPQAGETVLFKASAIAYNEGKVEKIDGSKYEIRSGSNIAKVDAADVYALPKSGAKNDLKAGDIVAAFANDIYWAGGEVININGDVVEVEKASGGKLNVAPDKVIKVSPTATADIKQHIAAKAFEDAGKTKKPVLPKDWKPKKGEKVAAQWAFGSWHVAIIKNVNPNNIDIDWQNGWSDGTVALDKVAPYPTSATAMPNVNDYVIIKPQNDISDWKFATVTAVNGQEAEVKLADGKTQKLKAGDFIALS